MSDRTKDLEDTVAERIAAFIEADVRHYPEDIFIPGGSSVDAQSADTIRVMYPILARRIREGEWKGESV